jgi:hypothetical protein
VKRLQGESRHDNAFTGGTKSARSPSPSPSKVKVNDHVNDNVKVDDAIMDQGGGFGVAQR